MSLNFVWETFPRKTLYKAIFGGQVEGSVEGLDHNGIKGLIERLINLTFFAGVSRVNRFTSGDTIGQIVPPCNQLKYQRYSEHFWKLN